LNAFLRLLVLQLWKDISGKQIRERDDKEREKLKEEVKKGKRGNESSKKVLKLKFNWSDLKTFLWDFLLNSNDIGSEFYYSVLIYSFIFVFFFLVLETTFDTKLADDHCGSRHGEIWTYSQ
jgi:hypothetical protein